MGAAPLRPCTRPRQPPPPTLTGEVDLVCRLAVLRGQLIVPGRLQLPLQVQVVPARALAAASPLTGGHMQRSGCSGCQWPPAVSRAAVLGAPHGARPPPTAPTHLIGSSSVVALAMEYAYLDGWVCVMGRGGSWAGPWSAGSSLRGTAPPAAVKCSHLLHPAPLLVCLLVLLQGKAVGGRRGVSTYVLSAAVPGMQAGRRCPGPAPT